MRKSLDCCRIEKLDLAKTIKKKWKKEGQEESGIGEGKNLHNAFHFNVAIRLILKDNLAENMYFMS